MLSFGKGREVVRAMFLVSFFGTLLFTLGSCSIIALEPFPEVIERSSPSLDNVIQGELIKKSLTKELQEHRNHLLGKLEFLSAACKRQSSFPEGTFNYSVSTDAFRDPRINVLVKVMSKKLQEIAEISMDDLDQKLQRFKLLVTQRILDKFTPLLSDIADLQNQMKNMAKKREFTQIGSDVTNVIMSRSDEVSTILTSLSTKNDFNTRSSRLMELSESIHRKIETLRQCENSEIKDSALEISNKLNGDFARIRENLRILSHTMDDAASNNAKELLQETLTMAKMNGLVVTALTSLTGELKDKYTNTLDRLMVDLNEISVRVNDSSFSSVMEGEELTAPEQAHQLNEDVKGIVDPLPCLDSKFTGHGRSLDICGAAVRLRKCYLQIVAFHCCRSCMDAGLISTAPNMSTSRSLSALKALTFLKPT